VRRRIVNLAGAVACMIGLGALPASCEGSGAAGGQRAAAAPERAGIALPGDCRGAWWDARDESLFITDVTHDELIRWRDGAGFAVVAKLPPASSLGGVVRLADGRFVISSFGFGEGAIYVVERGEARPVGKLDPGRRRTGLALAPDGAVYAAYFEVAPRGVPRGGVSRLELAREDGGEVDVGAADLRKPVGLAATETSLYVTDQHRAALYVIPRAGGAAAAVSTIAPELPDLPGPELVAALPGGALIVVSRDGVVFRVPAGGPAIQIARGFGEVRGIAYDPGRARLFLLEQRAAEPRHQLHILPVVR
jgi:hypothetical protein